MTGPLAGLRVLELAGIGPAPFAAMLLADLGADVVRVDRHGGGNTLVDYRQDLLNRGKRSIALNLKDPADVETVLRLVEQADVLIEGFRPRVAERLGVGPSECLARQPKLVYGRMTGWGQDGPRAQTAGHDLTYLALSGVLHSLGRAGGPPQFPGNLLGDFGGGGMYLVTGILAALFATRGGAAGQVVDAAIVDGVAHLGTLLTGLVAAGAWRDERGVNLFDGGAPFYDVYATADGRHLAVGALETQFYAEFLTRLGLADEINDQFDRSRWPRLRSLITGAIATRTLAEWTEVFADSDACVAPVLTLAEAAADPHMATRDTYAEFAGVPQPAPAPRFSGTPAVLRTPPPWPGEHTEEILADWLEG